MKLDAPEGYRWTDPDVRSEKWDSWWSGFMVGTTVAFAIALILLTLGAI